MLANESALAIVTNRPVAKRTRALLIMVAGGIVDSICSSVVVCSIGGETKSYIITRFSSDGVQLSINPIPLALVRQQGATNQGDPNNNEM